MSQQPTVWGVVFIAATSIGGCVMIISWPFLVGRLNNLNKERVLLEKVRATTLAPRRSFEGGVLSKLPAVRAIANWREFSRFAVSDVGNEKAGILEAKCNFIEAERRFWSLLTPVLIIFAICLSVLVVEIILVSMGSVQFI